MNALYRLSQAALCLFFLAVPASAQIVVNSTQSGSGDGGNCTLSEAVTAAANNAAEDACTDASANWDTIDLTGVTRLQTGHGDIARILVLMK